MPQAVQAPAQDETKDGNGAAKEAWAELVKRATSGDTSGARMVAKAIELEHEISGLRKKVDDNRKYLRLMDSMDELTDDQAEFLDTFYPEKERGERRSQEEVEATRLAREAARKGGK